MKTYIYLLTEGSDARGFNRTVTVWRVKNNVPVWLASNNRIHTKGWRGDKCEAALLIAETEGYKLDKYKIVNKDVQIIGL